MGGEGISGLNVSSPPAVQQESHRCSLNPNKDMETPSFWQVQSNNQPDSTPGLVEHWQDRLKDPYWGFWCYSVTSIRHGAMKERSSLSKSGSLPLNRRMSKASKPAPSYHTMECRSRETAPRGETPCTSQVVVGCRELRTVSPCHSISHPSR